MSATMLSLLSAVEATTDPLWLRTLTSLLPVVSGIVIAAIGAPHLWKAFQTRRSSQTNPEIPPQEGPGVPPQVAVAVTETASNDPILRLFIDDLHSRLSTAHQEAAQLHQLRAVDAGTIARLTTELADKENRLQECESELLDSSTQNRALIGRLNQLKNDLELTQRKLQICREGRFPPNVGPNAVEPD